MSPEKGFFKFRRVGRGSSGVEQLIRNQQVVSSNLIPGSFTLFFDPKLGSCPPKSANRRNAGGSSNLPDGRQVSSPARIHVLGGMESFFTFAALLFNPARVVKLVDTYV